MYVFASLIAATIILIILVCLQVIWIRSKIYSIQFNFQGKEKQMRDQLVEDIERQNRLQVYGVKMDCRATGALNESNMRFGNELLPFIVPKSFLVPYICSGKVESLQVAINKAGFLVTLKNTGADDLANDIISQKIRYVILADTFFLIHYDTTNNYNRLVEKIKHMNIPLVSSKIETRNIFFLYAIDSQLNILPNNYTDCSINIATFLGKGFMLSESRSSSLIDLKHIIGFSDSQDELPIHILGYKIT